MDAIPAPKPGPHPGPTAGEAGHHVDRIEAAVTALEELLRDGARPPVEHVAAFDEIHRILGDALAQTER